MRDDDDRFVSGKLEIIDEHLMWVGGWRGGGGGRHTLEREHFKKKYFHLEFNEKIFADSHNDDFGNRI